MGNGRYSDGSDRFGRWAATGLGGLFLANVLLSAAEARLGIGTGAFMTRVPEFLCLLGSCLAFAIVTLHREQQASQRSGSSADRHDKPSSEG